MAATISAAIIVNPHSGAPPHRLRPDALGLLLSAAGIDHSISVIGDRQDAAGLARKAVRDGFKTVVACGGDGTVSGVASALAGTESALGVLPLGTFNHFAKDLLIPLDPAGASRVIAQRKTELVDIAEVNGQPFINNSSLGIYPNIVLERERRRRAGLNKWVALGLATLNILRRYPFLDVRINAQGHCIAQRTPFVFLGNNEYEIHGLNIGKRHTLNAGRLFLYVAEPVSRARLIRMAIAALLGHLDQRHGLQLFSLQEAWIETRRRRVRVSIDGEVLHLKTPLHYALRPRALQVIVP